MSMFPPPQLQDKLALIKLQQSRSSKLALWRSCLMICCALSLSLAATLPKSQVKDQGQIRVNGTKLVSQDTIYQALNFSYPQFIWSVNGMDLTQKVESIPSIKAAKVSKQIIPPIITISLQEKIPVALATSKGKVGFLNSEGEWVEQEFYTNVDGNYPLPQLKVIDYQMQFRTAWSKIYELILLYPQLKVNEIHWQSSGGIFINTKIGQVFLGSELSRLEQQFKIISKLENLPEHLESSKIAYIDLSSPGVNLIQKY